MVTGRSGNPLRQEKPAPGKKTTTRLLKRGDICWADFPSCGEGANQVKRPALLIQNNMGNRFSPTVIVTPISSRISRQQYPINVILPEGTLDRPAEIRAGQIVTIDRFRLGPRITRLPASVMARVDEAIRVSLGLPRDREGS
ncbi:MAG: type II toxin-antitoxin system PemK/MazF family toxin [Thermoleophilia bacterium]